MQRSILFCLLLVPLGLKAQLRYGRPHVVKDNVACLYGLKNDSNQWIVPAQYTSLSDLQSCYIAINSKSLRGVINLRGKLVVPVQYELVQPISNHREEPDIFIVGKADKYGIVDSAGAEILPPIYDGIEFVYLATYPHRYFVLKKNDEFALIDQTLKYYIPFSKNVIETSGRDLIRYKLRIITGDGKVGLADSTGVIILPIYYSLTALDPWGKTFPDYFVATDFTDKHGLLNSSGDTLLPFSLANITANVGDVKRIIVSDENTFGIYDSNFRVIIPEGSKFIGSGDGKHIPILPTDTCAVRRENRWGLMSGNGNWITPQLYDTIIYPDFVPGNSRRHFTVKSKGKYGVINPAGKIIIPIEYDMLVQCSDTRTSSGQSGCIVTIYTYGTYFYVGKKNGFYGATKSDGSNFVPYAYDTIITSNEWYDRYDRDVPGAQYAHNDLYFTGQDKALYLKRGTESTYYSSSSWSTPYSLTYFFNVNKDVKVYRNGENYFPFVNVSSGNKTMLSPARDVTVDIDPDNYDQLQVRVGNYYEKFLYFDRKTGKPIIDALEGVDLVARAGENHIFQSEKMLGVISPEGKVLVKPAYIGMSYIKSWDGKAYLWTKSSADSSCASYDTKNNCACGWRLCNANGIPLTTQVFDFPQALTSEVQPMVVDGKVGLFNTTKMKFVRSPIYVDITDIYTANGQSEYSNANPTLFYVTRGNGQFGIMNALGQWISDSTYDYMIPYPRRNNLVAMSSRTNQFTERRWLMIGSEHHTMIDGLGRTTSDSMLIDSLIQQSYILRDYGGYNYSGIFGDPTPEYMKTGLEVGYVSYRKTYIPGNQFTPENDSQYIDAFAATYHVLNEEYEYRLHRTPGSYGLDGSAYVVDEWVHHWNGYYRTVAPIHGQRLHADILYYSDKALSFQTTFNPDTSAAAANVPYPYYMNFTRNEKGEFIPVTLDSIFCPMVQYEFVLNKLIREAIKKRDDLNIDCGSEDGYYARTRGSFFFSDTGLVFNLPNASIGIPWKLIQPYSRPGGIVDRFIGNSKGEHCRPAYDTTEVNYTAQGLTSMKKLDASGYMSREKITSYEYIFSDSINHVVTGIRYCNGADMVIDVFFDPVVLKKSATGTYTYSEKVQAPKAIRGKKINRFYFIKHYPCVH